MSNNESGVWFWFYLHSKGIYFKKCSVFVVLFLFKIVALVVERDHCSILWHLRVYWTYCIWFVRIETWTPKAYEHFRHNGRSNDCGVKKMRRYGMRCYGIKWDAFSLSLSLRKGGFLFCVLSQHSTSITSFPGSLRINRFPGVTDDVMATVWKTQEMETKPQKQRIGYRPGADPKSGPTPQKPFSKVPVGTDQTWLVRLLWNFFGSIF